MRADCHQGGAVSDAYTHACIHTCRCPEVNTAGVTHKAECPMWPYLQNTRAGLPLLYSLTMVKTYSFSRRSNMKSFLEGA